MSFPFRISIYLLILIVPLFYRWKWNDNSVFVSSDPQIKYYQVIHNLEGGKAEECFFPASKLGFDISMIPFGYPWAFFLKNGECVFQYPVLFTWIQKLFISFSSVRWITYLPILFFFFNFLLLDRILKLYESRGGVLLISVLLIQCMTPIFLSSLDYSELTLTNFFFLSAILSFLEFQREKQFRYGILLAVSIVFNFQLRPESTIALFFFLGLAFGFGKNHWQLTKNLIPYVFLCVVLQLLFFVWNQNVYGHILGMRGLNTVTDMESGLKRDLTNEWLADLWGNDFKIGIFKGYPILFLSIVATWWDKKSEIRPFLFSGLLFVILLPILSPYRAGVDIFGMRYFESGIYLLMIGSFLSLAKKSKNYLFILILLPFLYFSYKSDTRAIKQWTSSSKLYHQMIDEINKIQPDLIVQRGLSLSYLVGNSYIEYPQIAVYSNEDWYKVETVLGTKKLRVLYLQWEGNHLVSNEFPAHIWKEKFDVNFTLNPKLYKIESEHKLAHFKGYLLEQRK
ncbi:hypothetical protein EHQ68_02125 [Leptospira congkakensis]|uniref:Glycosyltransferase RgtA/B/C/D-like domain-containing protein n=1 Tax=Leptospira congkakensis TaxID=2484932 RepID=A0A4Z1A6G5_9LEPT|nr:hypothetical protein [Leptospira congkakensis]TGL90253.1 hypothetical protein EHQ69_09885 [Leptospira congkakensis]TGL91260.1 hypothetical protein EHQ68_02125 [Leptospira congkakensis]TGL98312.1 hypothetical protein EHQ70_01710 [Leptospira congkakensis]